MNNTLKTGLLLGGLTLILVLMGRLLAGPSGMLVALGFSVIMNLGAWWFSDRIALAMSRAQEVNEQQAPGLHQMIESLAARAEIPKPRVYVIDSPAPNAFATGRSPEKGAVAVTAGIMNTLSQDELAGVVAHELAHIKNRDTLIASIAATLSGVIVTVADMARWSMMFGGYNRYNRSRDSSQSNNALAAVGGLLLVILAPIAATLIQLAISRSREYLADERGARILGNPLPLAEALEKIEYAARQITMPVNAATAPLYIVNPLKGGGLSALFSTHPPTAERVARLRAMARA